MSAHDIVNETMTFGFEGSTENCMTMLEGMLLQIPKNLKDLKEEMIKLKSENDFLKEELSKSNQPQIEPVSQAVNEQNQGEKSKVTIEDAQNLSNICRETVEELVSKKRRLSKDKFMQELATTYLDILMRQLTTNETTLDSYLSSTESTRWYEDSVLCEETLKLTEAKHFLEFMKAYVTKKDKEGDFLTFAKGNNNEQDKTTEMPLLYSQIRNEHCNFCKHMKSSFGMTMAKPLIHAKRLHDPKRGDVPYTETCPWIVSLPIVKKNHFLDAYGNFCKTCFSFHPNRTEPCKFTESFPGLKCRVKDCQTRYILCTKHHDANKNKLKRFKDNCEAVGIKANIDLTN